MRTTRHQGPDQCRPPLASNNRQRRQQRRQGPLADGRRIQQHPPQAGVHAGHYQELVRPRHFTVRMRGCGASSAG